MDNELDSYFLKIEQDITGSVQKEKDPDQNNSQSDASWSNEDQGNYQKQGKDEKGDNVIRVRGLPWSTKEKDIREFFSVCDNIVAIHFTYSREGRPTGEAYIELGSQEDADRALAKNRELMGQRYIEVFLSKKDEMEFVLKRSGHRPGSVVAGRGNGSEQSGGGDGGATADAETVVRLRGLPFGCTKEDIIGFFDGLEIATDGIIFAAQHQSSYGPQSGKRSKPGEAYVRFINKETTERALDRHMNKIGHRYIEVFRSTVDEMERMDNEPWKTTGGYGRGGTRPGPYSFPGSSGPVPLCSIAFPDFVGGQGGRGRSATSWNEGSRFSRGRGGGRSGPSQGLFGNYYPPNDYYDQVDYFDGGMNDGRGRLSSGRATGHVVHMRGLPYKSTANDIMEFFQPLKLVNVQILYDDRTGRPSGEAEVELCSHEDAVEAMKKDRQDMGGRYIELFLDSRPSSSTSSMRPGYGQIAGPSSDSGEVMISNPMPSTQSLIQYPGFRAYAFGKSDCDTTPIPPPPPPPTAQDSSNANAGFY